MPKRDFAKELYAKKRKLLDRGPLHTPLLSDKNFGKIYETRNETKMKHFSNFQKVKQKWNLSVIFKTLKMIQKETFQ